MIKYKLTGELKVELQDEKDSSNKLGIVYPINIAGLGYSFNHFINKKKDLQNIIKEFMDRGTV